MTIHRTSSDYFKLFIITAIRMLHLSPDDSASRQPSICCLGFTSSALMTPPDDSATRQPTSCCLGFTSLRLADVMPRRSSSTVKPTQRVPLSRWCWKCMRTFSTSSNMRRHQNQRATPCSPSDNITARQVQDEETGRLRFRTREERLERDRDRKREEYWRFLMG